ncbi:Fc.00g081740.m01.CDS01 [Cosmosporella sp. VM-42]
MPTLMCLNFIDGKGQDLNGRGSQAGSASSRVTGLDTLAWGNIRPENSRRYTVHLAMSIVAVVWVCAVSFIELKIYIKVRHDHLTSAQHRLRASATTILVCSIPRKWLSDQALRGLFDVFPGGVRNVWLNRDLSDLLQKVSQRAEIHAMLESAETELIRAAKKAQLKRKEGGDRLTRRRMDLPAATRPEVAICRGRGDQAAHEPAHRENSAPGDRLAQVGEGFRAAIVRADTVLDRGLRTTNGFRCLSQNEDPGLAHPAWQRRPAEMAGRAQPRRTDIVRGNTVRQLDGSCRFSVDNKTTWWQFWKPPPGSYISPIPQGHTPGETARRTTLGERIRRNRQHLPILGQKHEPVRYPAACNPGSARCENDPALWEQHLRRSDRPTHRLPLFQVAWLPALPRISQEVDTIFWCREQLARLNVEIEQDQRELERFPLMNSAFVQFNNQTAAHMACQCQIHHLPESMAPRLCEISPRDVIWSNMSLTWWQEWFRTVVTVGILVLMTALWAVPVASTVTLSQLDQLLQHLSWFPSAEDNAALAGAVKAVAGVLPTVVLALLLFLVPSILEALARFRGAKTGIQITEFVQTWFFIFLWVQVFLVVSLASFATLTLDRLLENVEKIKDASDILQLLATSVPRAANYFFSYMILQALSTSSTTLLQSTTVFEWFVVARLRDHTARSKWTRSVASLKEVRWGNFFPVYTNFACIALAYCVIAPLISAFAIISFSLLWVAHRYTMVYVARFEHDSGGVLYPRAINQTFVGIYTLELCVAGLFFMVEDQNATRSCTTYGGVMIVALFLTIVYQVLLNLVFSPLFRSLPITLEDEAVLRDEAFRRAQEAATRESTDGSEHRGPTARGAISGKLKGNEAGSSMRLPKGFVQEAAIRDALYRGSPDEMKDLDPQSRDFLTCQAFQHEALRSRPPVVWIPRDDLGISKDEIRQTENYSQAIQISNEGAALDGKACVVFGSNPPDFSEWDSIQL